MLFGLDLCHSLLSYQPISVSLQSLTMASHQAPLAQVPRVTFQSLAGLCMRRINSKVELLIEKSPG